MNKIMVVIVSLAISGCAGTEISGRNKCGQWVGLLGDKDSCYTAVGSTSSSRQAPQASQDSVYPSREQIIQRESFKCINSGGVYNPSAGCIK